MGCGDVRLLKTIGSVDFTGQERTALNKLTMPARAISHDLLAWYNNAHHHSGLSYLTPADVQYGRAPAILDLRHRTRLVAYAAHLERFVSGPPRPETLPTAVWINPPSNTTRQDAPRPTTGTPDNSQYAVVARPRPPLDRSSFHRVDGVESLQ